MKVGERSRRKFKENGEIVSKSIQKRICTLKNLYITGRRPT